MFPLLGLCDAGFYCRASAYTSSPPEGLLGGLCPVGGYCPIGTAAPEPCDPGYYVPSEGSKSKFDCIPCEPGKFCAGSSGSAATDECFPGYYCTGGASTGSQFETPAGSYSLAGSWAATPCPRETYQKRYVIIQYLDNTTQNLNIVHLEQRTTLTWHVYDCI